MIFPKKIRYFFRFFSAIFKKQSKNILIGLILGVISYFSFPLVFKLIPKPKQKIKIGVVGQYMVNEIPNEILNEISSGLVSISENGEVLPALAESWKIENNGKTYIFKIKPQSFVWHDNQILVPTDINYNFKDVEYKIEGWDIIFNLKEPYSPFLSVVSKPVFKKGLIGVGKYKVSKIEKRGQTIKSIHLNPVDKTDQNLPLKIYRFYPTENDLKTAFNLGEINYVENLFSVDGIFSGKNAEIEKVIRKDAYLALIINNSKPFLETKSFRQALAYAIPKEKGELRAISPIHPDSWAYYPDVKPYLEDTQRSLTLLENDESDLSNVNIVISTFPQYEKIAKTIKEAWEKIGIKSEVQITLFPPDDFDVFLVARETFLEPDQYYFWHSTQAGNIGNFKNPRIDKLLEDGRKTIDLEARRDIYFDFQRFLSEEVPAVFLSHPVAYTVTRNSIFQNN